MSRMTNQEAIEILEKEKAYMLGHGGDRQVVALDMATKSLEQEPRWIPVSERLPEENGEYLVTVKRGYVTRGLWCGIAEYWNEVIAWMPLLLPKPYKSEIITCMDCKHWDGTSYSPLCKKHNILMNKDDFCSNGERRE